ncbi:hypothetical protein MTE01_28400 [Microbacterium testaceum]|uniref:Uncharacterized protein n=1 Tax=Microbacterium testaceum TaxID=2033 RepID=A0A4Y3QNQ7_MICTE|nr:hypothetical protein MTE01_28400 [Microbacterium testaceum]
MSARSLVSDTDMRFPLPPIRGSHPRCRASPPSEPAREDFRPPDVHDNEIHLMGECEGEIARRKGGSRVTGGPTAIRSDAHHERDAVSRQPHTLSKANEIP